MKKVSFNLRLPAKLHSDMKKLSKRNRRSLHSEILTAISFCLSSALSPESHCQTLVHESHLGKTRSRSKSRRGENDGLTRLIEKARRAFPVGGEG